MIQSFLRRATEKVSEAFFAGTSTMIESGRTHFTPEFILWGLLEEEGTTLAPVIEAAATVDNPIERLKSALAQAIRDLPGGGRHPRKETAITFGDEISVVLDQAQIEARNFGDRYVGTWALFLALFDPKAGDVAQLLHAAGLDRERVRTVMNERRSSEEKIEDREAESRIDVLKTYTTDLTEIARRGELDPVVGREREI